MTLKCTHCNTTPVAIVFNHVEKSVHTVCTRCGAKAS